MRNTSVNWRGYIFPVPSEAMTSLRIQVAELTLHFFVTVDLAKDTVRGLKEKIKGASYFSRGERLPGK